MLQQCISPWFVGFDDPAIFLKPGIQELGAKLQIISLGSSSTEDDSEPKKIEESTIDKASNVNLQDILQKRGKKLI